MKKLLIGLLALGSISSFAGTLQNRASGEKIIFNLDENTQSLEIKSTSSQVENQTVILINIQREESSIDLIAANNWATEDVYEGGFSGTVGGDTGLVVFSFIVPIMNFPRLGATAFDLVALPVKAPIKLFKSMMYNRDFNKLQNAINSNDVIKVSKSRFNRIANLLK